MSVTKTTTSAGLANLGRVLTQAMNKYSNLTKPATPAAPTTKILQAANPVAQVAPRTPVTNTTAYKAPSGRTYTNWSPKTATPVKPTPTIAQPASKPMAAPVVPTAPTVPTALPNAPVAAPSVTPPTAVAPAQPVAPVAPPQNLVTAQPGGVDQLDWAGHSDGQMIQGPGFNNGPGLGQPPVSIPMNQLSSGPLVNGLTSGIALVDGQPYGSQPAAQPISPNQLYNGGGALDGLMGQIQPMAAGMNIYNSLTGVK